MKVLLLLLISSLFVLAEKEAVPEVTQLFSPHHKAFKKEINSSDLTPLAMTISTIDPDASEYVWAGFSYLHAGWDVQAYRHFCQALRLDENCLMAHAGLILSLSSPHHHELLPQRKAALLRLVELIEYKAGNTYYFPERERGFAIATAYLFTEGRNTAAKVFAELAKKYPKDHQILMLSAVFQRDGYNVLNRPNSGEKKALKVIKDFYEKNPENFLAMQYMLIMHIEAPLTPDQLKKEMLPIARKLAELKTVATWQHWLGVYEYRCGNAKEAVAAFKKSITLTTQWKRNNNISNADADALWKSQLYLATLYSELGETEKSQKIAQELKEQTIDSERLWASGTQLLLWDGLSLEARLLAQNTPELALKALPKFSDETKIQKASAAYFFHKSYANYLKIKQAIQLNQKKKALEYLTLLNQQTVQILQLQKIATQTGEVHAFKRHLHHQNQYRKELNALMSNSNVEKIIAWEDAQTLEKLSSQMLPPLHCHSAAIPLAQLHIQEKEYEEAAKALQKTLAKRPCLSKAWHLLTTTVGK